MLGILLACYLAYAGWTRKHWLTPLVTAAVVAPVALAEVFYFSYLRGQVGLRSFTWLQLTGIVLDLFLVFVAVFWLARGARRLLGPTEGWTLSGRHILSILALFFGVVFIVNGYFLYSALSTHTGVISNEPYRKGLAYNETIEAAEQQASLGWIDAVEALPGAPIVFSLRKSTGEPVQGLKLRGFVGRPATAQLDRPLAFREAAPGRYAADAGKLESGTWMLTIEAAESQGGSDKVVWRARKRLWLKP